MARRTPRPATWHPALVRFYDESFKKVVSAVRFYGVPERDSADVTQDVFVRAHASFHGYDPKLSLRAWLMTITYRAAVDYRRSAEAQTTRPAAPEDFVEIVDMAPNPERRTLEAQARSVFATAVQQLSEEHRAIFLMNFVDEIPVTEIAMALGENENTVRSRLHRAHQAFDAALAALRVDEERRSSALAPLLVPGALAGVARQGYEIDPALQALVRSRLARLLGMGIIGTLAPLSGPAIAAGAGLLLALGGGAGALLNAALERPPANEATVHAETEPRASPAAASATTGAATATATATATPSMTASAAAPDAGAQDPAAALRAELAILAKAREAMGGEHYEAALRELNRHERLFPNGKLAEQRKDMKRVVLAELSARDGGSR
jgi:RNA polymerase sigma-70 factor (ECF subfamily)